MAAAVISAQHTPATSTTPDDICDQDVFAGIFSNPLHNFSEKSWSAAGADMHRRRASCKPDASTNVDDYRPSSPGTKPRTTSAISPLPAFSFNPAASMATPLAASPPAPNPYTAGACSKTPTRGGRHHKSISEYVGGNTILASPRVRSVSPRKSDSQDLPCAAEQRSTPPYRRHGHRRSAAISQDLNLVSRSGPPLEILLVADPVHVRRSSETFHQATAPPSSLSQFPAPGFATRQETRNRVLFAEHPQYIPHSLSTISSGIESPLFSGKGHSASRSTSAGGFHEPRTTRNELPSLSAPSLDNVFTFSNTGGSASYNDLTSISNPTGGAERGNRQDLAFLRTISDRGDLSLPTTSTYEPILLCEDFDIDPTSTIILETTEPDYTPVPFPATTTSTLSNRADKVDSPIIDLDSALSSFQDGDETEDGCVKARGFSKARRSMHSSGLMSGFFGPGMHYHRRAESAPSFGRYDCSAMDGIRPSAAAETGFTMDDVNEEEEDALAVIKSSTKVSVQSRRNAVLSQDMNEAAGSSLIGEVYGEAVHAVDDTQSDLRSDPGDNLCTESSCTPATEPEYGPSFPEFVSHSKPRMFESATAIESDMGPSASTIISIDANHHQRQTAPHQLFRTISPVGNDNNPPKSAMEQQQPPPASASMHEHGSLPAEKSSRFTISDEDAATRRTSVDDGPSLMSSPSTMTSDTYRDRLSTSHRMITASEARSGTSTPSVSSSSRGRYRRSSILSLSRLMSNGFQERSASPTRPGRKPQAMESKRGSKDGQGRRFKQIFNFLKSN